MDDTLKIIRKGENILVFTPFNEGFVEKMRKLNGFWDYEQQCWWLNARRIPAVRSAMRDFFGTDDTNGADTTTVWLTFRQSQGAFRSDYCLLGKVLCHATSRNSGGIPGEDVYFLSGKPESGGSVKNWSSIIPAGSVIRLSNVPWALLDSLVLPPNIDIEYYGNDPVDKDALMEERAKLAARIEEIDKLLAT